MARNKTTTTPTTTLTTTTPTTTPTTTALTTANYTTQIDTLVVARCTGVSGAVRIGMDGHSLLQHAAIALDYPPEIFDIRRLDVTLGHDQQKVQPQEAWDYLNGLLPAGWTLEPVGQNNLEIHRVTPDGWYTVGGFAYGFRLYEPGTSQMKRQPRVSGLVLRVEFLAVLQNH